MLALGARQRIALPGALTFRGSQDTRAFARIFEEAGGKPFEREHLPMEALRAQYEGAGDPIQKTGHMRLPGTISLSSEVYVGLMRQVALSAISAGFKNIFLMGEHGQGQG